MKDLKNKKITFKLRFIGYLAVLGFIFFGSLQSAQAQLVTFAQVLQKNGSNDFVFTNNGGASATFGTIGGGVPVDFRYFNNIVGLPPSIQGFQDARLFMNAVTTAPGSTNGTTATQPFNGVNTIQIIRDVAAPVDTGTGTRRNLLTITFSTNTTAPRINGEDGGFGAGFAATTPDNAVIFTSDFLTFPSSTQRNFGLTFSSLLPSLTIGAGSFLNSFAAAGTGTFSSNPVPTAGGPTAAAVNLSGRVLTAAGRGLRNAQVTVTQADGSTRTVLTGTSGRYSFTDLEAGQTVILSVRSKQYQFMPQVVFLNDDLNEIDFVANR